jgi:ferritin-like metal-binding protein YciE
MSERFNSRKDFLEYKLGGALRMERVVLEMLDSGIDRGQDAGLKQLLRDHHGQTRRHVTNLESAFGLMGWDAQEQRCPAMEAYEKELERELGMSDEALVDGVLLAAAASVEHYEIAVYGTLMAWAQSLDRDDVGELLERNRDEEQTALDRIRAEAVRVLGSQLP